MNFGIFCQIRGGDKCSAGSSFQTPSATRNRKKFRKALNFLAADRGETP